MRSYFMRSKRLGFGTWSAADLSLARELWGDSRVTRLIGGPFTESEIRERLHREIATQQSFGFQYWPIFRLSDDQHVGCSGLRPHREQGVPEIGFHIRPECWGKGYASESVRRVAEYAFRVLGAHVLFAGHHPDNKESERLLQHLGFQFVGLEYYPPTGLEHPSYLLRHEHSAGSNERLQSQE